MGGAQRERERERTSKRSNGTDGATMEGQLWPPSYLFTKERQVRRGEAGEKRNKRGKGAHLPPTFRQLSRIILGQQAPPSTDD